jgi:hypothetical protein
LPKSSTYANAVRGGSGRRSVTGPVELRRSSGLAAVIRRRRRLRSPATQIRRARTTAPRPRNQAHRSARIGNASDVGKKGKESRTGRAMVAQHLPQRTGKTEGEPQRRRQRALYPVACGPAGRHLPRRLPSLPHHKRYIGTRALLLHGATRAVSE